MLFSSPSFLFIFLPSFLLLFYLAGSKLRDYVLLLSSFLFYFWGEPIFCCVAVLSAFFDFWVGQKIAILISANQKAKANYYVTLGVLANIGILFYYKYMNFFLGGISQLLFGAEHPIFFNIILPIGVSFIVFEKITYIVDIYRGTGKPAGSLLRYMNYVLLFPKLLAGPIIKYHDIEKQLVKHQFTIDDIGSGFTRFLLGLTKKVFLADTLAELVNPIFAIPSGHLSCSLAWIGVICFTLQIYFDFSGYSDMAIGLSRMLGFRLNENFNMPYIAKSFTEFWRRWHISLSSWIREYLYIPLGGNQVSQPRMYINLWICFLLSGLWHGANITFILWGAYNGLFLILDRIIWLQWSDKLPPVLCSIVTLFFVMIGWVIFRVANLDQLQHYLLALMGATGVDVPYVDITLNNTIAMIIGSFLALVPLLPNFNKYYHSVNQWKLSPMIKSVFYGNAGFFAICKVVSVTFVPFLYFKF